MVGVYASSLIVCAAALLLGTAITGLCLEERPSWAAAAVGNATLLVAATVLIRLPGAWVTAMVLLGALILSISWAARARRGPAFPEHTALAVPVAAIPLVLVALPFLAAGHFGPLGVGLDDDLGFHVAWVQSLHAGHPPFALTPNSYPIGLESLAAVLSGLAGGGEQALLGVGAAALALAGLTAFAALERSPVIVRLVGAVAVSVPYLSAAYFGEGSFKEPEMAMLVLAFALLSAPHAPMARGPAVAGRARRQPLRRAIPLIALVLGMFVTLGYAGLAFPAAILVARAGLDLIGRRDHRARGWVTAAAAAASCGVVLAILYLAVPRKGVYGLFVHSAKGHPGGNLVRALPLTEGLGAWGHADFRVSAGSSPFDTALVGVVLAALAVAVAVSLRRRDGSLLVPAAVVAAIALAARGLVNPYDSTKALVIAGPLVVLVSIAALSQRSASTRRRWVHSLGALAAFAVSGAVLFSSVHVLWASPVDAATNEAQLSAMRPLVAGRTVLFLARDDWVQTALPDARVVLVEPYGAQLRAPLALRPGKAPGGPFDFDSEPPAGLDGVSFVITTGTLDASSPPPNFRAVLRTTDYVLWARHGRTPPRDVLAEGTQPGAVLDCAVPAMAALARRRGVASVRSAPVAAADWRYASGAPAPRDPSSGYAFSPPGAEMAVHMKLPSGRWQLSLEYQSANPISVTVGATVVHLPSRLEPAGALWPVADVKSAGAALRITLGVADHRVPASVEGALAGPVLAVRTDLSDTIVPLRRACGRYVDWYRVDG